MIYVITADIISGYKTIRGRFSTMDEATKYASTINQTKEKVFIAKVSTSNNQNN